MSTETASPQQTSQTVSDDPLKIEHDGILFAMIIPANFKGEGVRFFTPQDFSQQVAYMQHARGVEIDAHVHNHMPREVHYTQEVLIIRKGQLRVDFYSHAQDYVESRVLHPGDVMLIVDGGHGFEVLEDVELIEIKQGPYLGEDDKVRFSSFSKDQLRVVE